MRDIVADKELIAYCGTCKAFLKNKCPGCKKNGKTSWCKTRVCCIGNKYSSCADCTIVSDAKNCKKFHNIFSKVIGFILGSDRPGCIEYIKKNGYENFAKEMASCKSMSV